ncbi:hypothetical protein [Formosa algae]|uniref:Uncharacterized protein n=1 Tax=Formosa algae TaxID=225843 RepID=A0A9X0YK75_9FLAO|nr:hypothetical protein [Formosa algae]MBP1838767.1 hypothetical protein [Formosa algae]MDQ0335267.1 hypothetical protein [Formosa algae]OEI79848.1 hypothetical protein AST99_12360 [Formosa algae]
MNVDDLFEESQNQNIQIDYKKYLIELLTRHIMNQQTLRAVMETQILILAKLNDNPNIDFDEELVKLNEKIDVATDIEISETLQNIIRK